MVAGIDSTRGRLLRALYHDEIALDCGNAIIELCDTYDESKLKSTKPEGESYRSERTLVSWMTQLLLFATHRDLTTTTTDGIIRDLQAMRDGTHPETKSEDGIGASTLRSYESSLRVFYNHFDFGVNPEDIPMEKSPQTHIDPEDILTKDEIHRARNACTNPRDRMVFDLLVYTGQRREALVTLRIKDIDIENRTYRYNAEASGLKGAEKRNGKRPLLGALASVRTWINEFHPDPKPENYLITQLPSYSQRNADRPVNSEMILRISKAVGEKAGIDKPMNAHNMRHAFVTLMKRDYRLDNDTIKYYIGHAKGSNVMETTYSHLSGDDYVKKGEEAFGIREPKETSPLTPPTCDICDEPLQDDWQTCPYCGHVYGPNAATARSAIEEGMHDEGVATDTEQQRIDHEKIRAFVEDNEDVMIDLMGELLSEKQQQGQGHE